MRLIGTFHNEQSAIVFAHILQEKGIQYELEMTSPNRDWGSNNYGSVDCHVWIYDEDQYAEALKWYQLFQENPHDPNFTHAMRTSLAAPPSLPDSPVTLRRSNLDRRPMGPITRLLFITCCVLFLLTQLSTPQYAKVASNIPLAPLFMSPVEKALLYDYPERYQLVDRFAKLYGIEGLQNVNELPTEGQYLIRKIIQTPSWQGIYDVVQRRGISAIRSYVEQTPMFEKIQQGEVWRLFSPALLHSDIFHIFFNVLWLIVVGKQMEQRLKGWRYILFILIAGIFSNTAQYLVGGPNFIGLSGVLCGMIAFIWVRQQNAPWEGYELDRMTLIFIMLFIFGMAILQSLFFVIGSATNQPFSSGLANTAHLAGAFIGYILGKINYFSWKHS